MQGVRLNRTDVRRTPSARLTRKIGIANADAGTDSAVGYAVGADCVAPSWEAPWQSEMRLPDVTAGRGELCAASGHHKEVH